MSCRRELENVDDHFSDFEEVDIKRFPPTQGYTISFPLFAVCSETPLYATFRFICS